MTDSSEIDPATLPEIKNVDDEPDLSASESKEEAETKGLSLKDQGNTALKEGHYTEAIHHYSTALSHLPDNAIILSNRALAYIKVENYGLAIQECVIFVCCSVCFCIVFIVSYVTHILQYLIHYYSATHAIESDATYPKGYYRRGTAEFGKSIYICIYKFVHMICTQKLTHLLDTTRQQH